MQTIKMNNGLSIPTVGYGTYLAPDGDVAKNGVIKAIELGYRHIDGAACYKNEKSVGEGIRDCGINRDEIFLTSKVWNTERGYDKTLKAFEKTINDLGVDYLDLYLIHWPANEMHYKNWKELNLDTWRALEHLNQKGLAKSIGVSNFLVNHLEPLLDQAKIVPAINQIEFHPGYWQPETTKYCQEKGIIIEGWAPLGAGKLLENELLLSLAAKYGKTVSQIALRWSVQRNAVPLPKSVTPSRIAENLNIFDFEISSEDIQLIDQMPQCAWSGGNPNEANYL